MILSRLGPRQSRPVLVAASIINVSISFLLTEIVQLDDVRQELKVAGWFNMKWHNELINWDPIEYDVDCVYIPVNNIWKPDIILYNNHDEDYQYFQHDQPVQICSDGSATYATNSIFKSSCNIHIELYPYDSQTCNLIFGSWNYDEFELDIIPQVNKMDQKNLFKDNGVWNLLRVEAQRETDEYYTEFNPHVFAVFSIYLKRRHEFYWKFIFIPYFFCSYLTCLVFFIPIKSDEKLTYGITSVLAMIVFQQIIALSLPPVGNESSAFGMYFNAVIGIGSISMFLEILICNIYKQGSVYKLYVKLKNYDRTKKAEDRRKQKPDEEEATTGNAEDPQPTVDLQPTAEPLNDEDRKAATASDDDKKEKEKEKQRELHRMCAFVDFTLGILVFVSLLILTIYFNVAL